MRVTLLGHATVLVEARGRTVLIDPVFDDPFAEGMLTSCPARRVVASRLPKIDILVLTDALADHFDPASLARLPRGVSVLFAKDSRIAYVLERLGFRSVRPLDPGVAVRIGEGAELLATPSPRKLPEFGVVVRDGSGTVWHPVTVPPSPEVIHRVRAAVGPIHLLLAPYAAPELHFFGSQRAGFPGQHLRAAIASAQQVAPALLVPASAGIRFAPPFEWTNSFLFPISRQRFLGDLARGAPGLATAPGDPGDLFELRGGAVERRAAASPAATLLADDTDRIAFDPTAAVPPLTDPNRDGYAAEVLDRQVRATFRELAEFARGAWATDPLVREHRRVAGSYGLGVVFPDGSQRWLRIRFGAEAPEFEEGEGATHGALNTTRVAASVLTARARCERVYPFTGGLTRGTVVSPAGLKDGNVTIEPREPPDLLMHYLRNRPPGWHQNMKRILDFQLAPLLAARSTR